MRVAAPRGNSPARPGRNAENRWRDSPGAKLPVMLEYVLVVFVEPVHAGLVFERSGWPLHITVVRFGVVLSGRDVAVLLDADIRPALGTTFRAAANAAFGRSGDVPVTLIEPAPGLQRLHEQVLARLTDVGAAVAGVGHALENYRPHVSILDGRRIDTGTERVVQQVALVDMRPGRDVHYRKVLRLWDGSSPDGVSEADGSGPRIPGRRRG